MTKDRVIGYCPHSPCPADKGQNEEVIVVQWLQGQRVLGVFFQAEPGSKNPGQGPCSNED